MQRHVPPFVILCLASGSGTARADAIDDERAEGESAEKIAALEDRLELHEQSARAARPRLQVSGYADVGFFAPQGNGAGIRTDIDNSAFPEHTDYAWVFYGDLLSTAINSRGEAADLGDLPGVERTDTIDSDGQPSFLVNEVNLTLTAGISSDAFFVGSVNFVPRSGEDLDAGDVLEMDLAQLEWMPTDSDRHSIFVGKVESVLGNEYKRRRADRRAGITPSLVHRYTSGTAVGVKARSKLFGSRLILAAAVTNGSFGTEHFHFHEELDSNVFKTLSGRAGLRLEVLGGTLEVGASGQYGTQDGAADGAGALWLAGADLEWMSPRLAIAAEWMRGAAPGDELSETYGLDLRNGGYVEATVMATSFLALHARGDLRDARVWQGDERLYITRSWRATAGTTLMLGRVQAKLEVLHNGEFGGVPSIANDVFTSSMVVSY